MIKILFIDFENNKKITLKGQTVKNSLNLILI